MNDDIVIGTSLALLIATGALFWIFSRPIEPIQHNHDLAKIERVVDGDTLVVEANYLPKGLGKSLYLRIHGIDTPELGGRAKCDIERNKAKLAKLYIEEQLKKSHDTRIWYNGFDKYGRILGDVLIDGEVFLSQKLMEQALAVRYGDSNERHDWCSN